MQVKSLDSLDSVTLGKNLSMHRRPTAAVRVHTIHHNWSMFTFLVLHFQPAMIHPSRWCKSTVITPILTQSNS